MKQKHHSGTPFSEVCFWIREVVFIDQVYFNNEELEISEIESILYGYLKSK